MHAEYLFFDKGGNRDTVEAIDKRFPEFYVISVFALLIKSINFCDRSGLVISSQNVDILWIFYLIGEKKANCLDSLSTAIDVIS